LARCLEDIIPALGILVGCIEMDSVSQERALLEGRISVGILVPSDLELLHVWVLIKYPVSLALPKPHPCANKPEIPLSLLKEEPFIGLNRMHPNYDDRLLKACRRAGFKPRIVKEADGAASAFVAAGFGAAVVSEPLQKIPAKDVVFRKLTPRGQSVGACGRRLGAGGDIRSSGEGVDGPFLILLEQELPVNAAHGSGALEGKPFIQAWPRGSLSNHSNVNARDETVCRPCGSSKSSGNPKAWRSITRKLFR
jgi:hypothetical protein